MIISNVVSSTLPSFLTTPSFVTRLLPLASCSWPTYCQKSNHSTQLNPAAAEQNHPTTAAQAEGKHVYG